jgi:hypothetical protein
VDSTGAGKLDAKNSISATRIDDYSAFFDPVRFVFKGEDGPVTYHLIVRFMRYEKDDARLLISSGGYYEGKVEVGGTKRQLMLVDGNANGVFNDLGYDRADCDRVRINEDRMLGKLIEVDNTFYEIEVPQDGAFVKLRKAEKVVLGQIKVPDTINSVNVAGENGNFERKPEKGLFTVPAGEYRLVNWNINRKDDRGTQWQVMGSGEGSAFEVPADGNVRLEIGEPIRAVLSSTELTNQVQLGLRFTSVNGETVYLRKGEENPPGPRLTLTSLDGAYRHTNKFEFG